MRRTRSEDLSRTDGILRDLGAVSAPAERAAVRELARAVGARAARLVAAGLLGTLTFIDPDLRDEHTVAVDGSVYGGYPGLVEGVRVGAPGAGRPRARGAGAPRVREGLDERGRGGHRGGGVAALRVTDRRRRPAGAPRTDRPGRLQRTAA